MSNNNKRVVSNITPYLNEGASLIVKSENQPISAGFPQMNFGNMPADNGLLIINNSQELNAIISSDERTKGFIKPFVSADGILKDKEQWCIWLYESNADDFVDFPEFYSRIQKLRKVRMDSSRPYLAETPHLFAQITQPFDIDLICIPRHSSEGREYIPIVFKSKDHIVGDTCMVVPFELWLFGVIQSKIHMIWVDKIGGKIETRYRYSAQVCYNTFPFPKISERKQQQIAEAAENILIMREGYPDKNLATLYDPEKMPDDLRKAHLLLDDVVESCYPGYPFTSDEARLESLFKMYEKLKNV